MNSLCWRARCTARLRETWMHALGPNICRVSAAVAARVRDRVLTAGAGQLAGGPEQSVVSE